MKKLKIVHRVRTYSKFWDAVLEGMSGSAVFRAHKSHQRYRGLISDVTSLRSDWNKIGQDFRVAIKKTRETTQPTA